MRFNLILESNNSPERLAELAKLAEDHGFEGVWVSNMHDGRDPFVNFVDAARATSRIRLGPVAVSPYELHPLKMGNALLTLNELSGGRAQIGVAAGDGGTAMAMDVPAKRRLRAVRECVEIINAMASGEMISYDGELYKVRWYHAKWATAPAPLVMVCAGGPQMLRSAAKYAQGIYLGDTLPEHVADIRKLIDPEIAAHNPHRDDFRLYNFWAWHVKEDREEALAEARMWLAARVTPWPAYGHRVLPDEDMQVVWANLNALSRAFYEQNPDIPEIPRDILDRLSDRCSCCSAIADLDREIDKLIAFKKAGLTDISLRLYADPEASIRLISERVMPAVND